MKDEQTITLVESINLNPNLDASAKLDLIKKTMSECREKQIGKILIEAIEKKGKKLAEKIDKKPGAFGSLLVPAKRGRGRPRKDEKKELSENAKMMIASAKEGDATKE
jgi:hypothetical protein